MGQGSFDLSVAKTNVISGRAAASQEVYDDGPVGNMRTICH